MPVSAEICWNFNPRSPHGERHGLIRPIEIFLVISIHAPRTGSDNLHRCLYPPEAHFNPRSPHGERLD